MRKNRGRGSKQRRCGPLIEPAAPARAPRPLCRAEMVLKVVRGDSTFVPATLGSEPIWLGRCLHCRSKLVVHPNGDTEANTTVEHIVPQHHGGTDAAENLALACRRCNHLKGARTDRRAPDDPVYLETIAKLRAERRRRLPRASVPT